MPINSLLFIIFIPYLAIFIAIVTFIILDIFPLSPLVILALLLSLLVGVIIAIYNYRRVNQAIALFGKEIKTGQRTSEYRSFEIYELSKLRFKLKNYLKSYFNQFKELSIQKRNLDKVLDTINQGMIMINSNEQIISMNRYAKDFFKFNGNFLGKYLVEVVRSQIFLDFYQKLTKSLVELEEDLEIHNPERKIIKAKSFFVKSEQDQMPLILIVFEDLTDRQKLENYRSDFVANVSHELRTPLTGIQGAVEALNRADLKDADFLKKFLAIIERQSNRLKDLIEDILRLSKIEKLEEQAAQAFELQAIASIINSAIKNLTNQAEKRRIVINANLDQEVEANVDGELIERAVSNLLENAIKYCEPEQSVWIELKKLANNQAEIIVKDNGPGIESKFLERIFERFYRVDSGRARDTGGTGLGLAIVKHIALLHGGSVSVVSEVGKGSEFTFIFNT